MTNTIDRREFLRTVLTIVAGATGVGALSSETAQGETMARRQAPQRLGLFRRRLQIHTVERTLSKLDNDSQRIFSLDNPLAQDRKAALYDRVSPIHIESDQLVKHNELRTPDLPQFLRDTNQRNELVEMPRFLWDSNEPDELIELMKKLGLKPPPQRPQWFFNSRFRR